MNKSLARMFELGIRAQFDTELAPPIVIIGRSGIGKTASTNAIGSALKRPVFGFEMAGKRPEDITGYAYADLEKGVMKFLPNAMVRSILNSKNAIVFFDEICDLDRMMQRSMHGVLCGKQFGDYTAPKGTAICGAGNPPEISATGGSLAITLVSRVCQLDAELDAMNWADGNENGFPSAQVGELPDNWTSLIPQKRAIVSEFIRKFPEHLDEDAQEAHLPAPCPRQWVHVAVYNAVCEAAKEMSCRLPLIRGCVGEGAALKYIAWEKEMDIPDWRDVLAGNYSIPPRGDQIQTLAKSVCAAVVAEDNAKLYQGAWGFLSDLAKAGYEDFAALAAPTLARRMPKGWSGNLPPEAATFAKILKEAGIIK